MLESEVFQTLKVFLIPILIVVTLLFFNENKAEKKNKSQVNEIKKVQMSLKRI